jgi:hypothetical protein
MTKQLTLVELSPWDPGIAGLRTLRYSNIGYVTRSSETPADEPYDDRIDSLVDVARHAFGRLQAVGPSSMAFGDLELDNEDGALDALADYAFDGRALTVYRAEVAASGALPAYPSGFDVYNFTMLSGYTRGTKFIVKTRGLESTLNQPIQVNKYAGDNVAPDGLEGGEELTGRSKPLLFGTAMGISPVCVNVDKQIYQISDSELASIGPVYDSGIRLGFGFPVKGVSGMTSVGTTRSSVATNDAIVVGTLFDKIYTSTDLVTWTLQHTAANGIFDGQWCPSVGLFVFVDGPNAITSPDGITWTTTSLAGPSALRVVEGLTSVLVIGTNAGGTAAVILSSTNGTAWTSRTTNFGGTITQAASGGYGDGRFIITGMVNSLTGHQEAVTSTDDGVTWAQITIPYDAGGSFSKINCDAVFLNDLWLVERNSGLIAVSVDGVTWALYPSGFSTDGAACNIGEFHYHEGVYYAFSQVITAAAAVPSTYAYSLDGVTWVPKPLGYQTTTTFGVGRCISWDFLIVVAGTHGLAVTDGVTTFASAADLEDDSLAPVPNTYGVFLDSAGSYIRLGAPPAGQVTCNASEGATSADRTPGQLWARVLELAGKVAGTDYSAADVTALDGACSDEAGIFIGDEITFGAVLDAIAATPGASWFTDRTGLARIKQLTLPSGSNVADFLAGDIIGRLERAEGEIPTYQHILSYRRNYTPMPSGLALGVRVENRESFSRKWSTVIDTDSSVQTVHPLARQVSGQTLFADAAGAGAEVARRQALFGDRRDWYPFAVEDIAEYRALELLDVVGLTHERYGLSSGLQFRILGIEPKTSRKELTLYLWGGV